MIDVLILGVLAGAIRSGSAVLLACLGEILSEKAGITNLGVEGSMLMGAGVGFAVTAATGDPLIGVLAGVAGGAALALFHAVMVIARGANQLASGLAAMFLGLGLTALIGAPYVKANVQGLDRVPIPGLSAIPVVGPTFFSHDLLTYLAFLLAPALWAFFKYTRWGLQLRAVGERPEVVYAAGLDPRLFQYLAVTAGGALAGLGGAQLSLAYTHTWFEGMTAGRGFIAVALVIFAAWNPLRAVVGALLFGGAIALNFQLQALGVQVSPYALDVMPYVLTLAVLLIWRRAGQRAMPEGLRVVFHGSS
jgi:simple sugar transport system permease protein